MKTLLAIAAVIVFLFAGTALYALGQAYVDQLYEQECSL